MGIVSLPSFGADPTSVTAALLDGKVDPLATEFNGSIDNDNIKASAGIVYSKLNLATSVVNADISASAAIVASKLDLSSVAQTIVMTSKAINCAKGSDIASATTTDIGAMVGNYGDVTGTTTITGLGTVQAGTQRVVRFTGALTLTHNGTSLLLPTAANITTVANDVAGFVSLGSGNWKCLWYQRYDGIPVGLPVATQANQETGTSLLTTVTPGRQQYHPSAAKAWAFWDGTATGTNAPAAGYNVTSVTRNAAGNYTVNLTTAMSGTSYCVIPGFNRDGGTTAGHGSVYSLGTGSFIVETDGGDFTTAIDYTNVHVVVYGDQ